MFYHMKHKWMLGVGSGNDSYPFSNEIVWAAQNLSGTQQLSMKADISIDTKLHNYKLNHLKRTPTLAPSKTICVRSRLERHQLIVLQAPCGKWVINYTSAYTLMLKLQPNSHIHILQRNVSDLILICSGGFWYMRSRCSMSMKWNYGMFPTF